MSDEIQLTKYQESVLREIVEAVGDPAATLSTIGAHLQQVHEDAQQRGNTAAAELVLASWDYIQQLAYQQGHTLNLAATARELAEIAQRELAKTQDDLEAVRGDYDDLTEAIDMGSESHDLLADYAAAIREEAEENTRNWLEDDLESYAFDSVTEQIDEAMGIFCESRGVPAPGYNASRHLIERVTGNTEWDLRQAVLWEQIIEIERELQEARDKEREAQLQKWQQEAADELARRAKEKAS